MGLTGQAVSRAAPLVDPEFGDLFLFVGRTPNIDDQLRYRESSTLSTHPADLVAAKVKLLWRMLQIASAEAKPHSR